MLRLCLQDSDWADTWAARADELLSALSGQDGAEQKLLGLLLAPQPPAWPRFAALPRDAAAAGPPLDAATESATAAPAAGPDTAAAANALVIAFANRLGCMAVFGGVNSDAPLR